MKQVLITGASGFVGRHLLRLLRDERPDWRVHAWGHQYDEEAAAGVAWSSVDISEFDQVAAAVRAAQPDYVVHLAAASHVGGSFRDPRGTWAVNVMGLLNLLEALALERPDATVAFVSSSEVYGESFKSGVPVDERAPLKPLNPYAASKAAGEVLAQTYARQGLRIVSLRPFNHIGPGQREEFAVPGFAAQIARIEAGLQEPRIEVGNLENLRDFHDVRDTVRAYLAALERAESLPVGAIFNLCSGAARKITHVLGDLLSLSSAKVTIVTDPNRLRPSEIAVACGDGSQAAARLAWKPQVGWSTSLRDVLDDWRDRVRRPGAQG